MGKAPGIQSGSAIILGGRGSNPHVRIGFIAWRAIRNNPRAFFTVPFPVWKECVNKNTVPFPVWKECVIESLIADELVYKA